MAELPRASDLHRDFLDGVEARLGSKVDRRNLSRWSVMGAGLAQAGVRSNIVVARTFDRQILDRCVGIEVDEYCTPRGPVRRFPSAKARGAMTLVRATTAAGSGEIPLGYEIRVPYNGRSYVFVTTASRSVGATDGTAGSPVTVDCEAQLAGADSSVGTVAAGLAATGLPAPLWDATLLPTSITVAGGTDEESDDEMKERQRLWESARQRATGAGIAFAARLVNGVKHVVIADVFDPHLGGWANVYIGDVNWQSTSLLRAEVAASLEAWRGKGAALNVRGLVLAEVTVSATLQMKRPVAFYSVSALREAGIVAAINYFGKGAYEYDLEMLKGRLARVHDDVTKVTLTAPVSSVPSPISPSMFKASGYLPSTLGVFRTTRAKVTINIEGPA